MTVGWLPGQLAEDVVAAGFGKVFDVQKVRTTAAVARYLTQYVTKAATQRAPRYVNRYSFTKGALAPSALWVKARRYDAHLTHPKKGRVPTDDGGWAAWWAHPNVRAHLAAEEAHPWNRSLTVAEGTRFVFIGTERELAERESPGPKVTRTDSRPCSEGAKERIRENPSTEGGRAA